MGRKVHCEWMDVMFDSETGDMMEKGCEDPNCVYCTRRPKNNSMVGMCEKCPLRNDTEYGCRGWKNKEE
jgi:hypothetical protein